MNGNERFEYMAELFYKETGLMAPGKESPAAFGVTDMEERQREFTKWVEIFYDELFDLHKSNSHRIENSSTCTNNDK